MYEIIFGGKTVGTVQMERVGLYYKFNCICKQPDEGIYRVIVSDGNNRHDLGICVPEGERFVLNKRIPCKLLTGDRLSFDLVEKNAGEIAVPVADGKPFEYLDQLETARLHMADGQTEIMIAPSQDQQGNGPNQEHQHKWESF